CGVLPQLFQGVPVFRSRRRGRLHGGAAHGDRQSRVAYRELLERFLARRARVEVRRQLAPLGLGQVAAKQPGEIGRIRAGGRWQGHGDDFSSLRWRIFPPEERFFTPLAASEFLPAVVLARGSWPRRPPRETF